MKTNTLDKDKRLKLLETRCRAEGLPVTVHRRVIFAALIDRDDHPTIDQIYDTVKDAIPGVSRTTVYRVLETLVELGLARKTHHLEAFARFDGNTAHHHHLVCLKCNKVSDFVDPSVNELSWPEANQNGFDMLDFSVYLEGICRQCKRLRKKLARTPG